MKLQMRMFKTGVVSNSPMLFREFGDLIKADRNAISSPDSHTTTFWRVILTNNWKNLVPNVWRVIYDSAVNVSPAVDQHVPRGNADRLGSGVSRISPNMSLFGVTGQKFIPVEIKL